MARKLLTRWPGRGWEEGPCVWVCLSLRLALHLEFQVCSGCGGHRAGAWAGEVKLPGCPLSWFGRFPHQGPRQAQGTLRMEAFGSPDRFPRGRRAGRC